MENFGSHHQRLYKENVGKTKKDKGMVYDLRKKDSGVVYAWGRC